MDETAIKKVVYEALELFGVEQADISTEATLEQLDIDSLDLLELGQLVQEKLGIKVEAEQFKGVETVGQAIEAIARAGKATKVASPE